MSDHEDLVADDEILGNSPGKFGLAVSAAVFCGSRGSRTNRCRPQ